MLSQEQNYYMRKLRESRGLDEYDTSQDAYIMGMSPGEMFDAFLTGEGIIHCTHSIIGAVNHFYGLQLEE